MERFDWDVYNLQLPLYETMTTYDARRSSQLRAPANAIIEISSSEGDVDMDRSPTDEVMDVDIFNKIAEARKLAAKSSSQRRLFDVNELRCSREPVFGASLRHLLTAPDRMFTDDNDPWYLHSLESFVASPQDVAVNMSELFKRFVKIIPPVVAKPASLHVSQPGSAWVWIPLSSFP